MSQFFMAAVLGILFAVGTFLLLRKDLVRVIWGTLILGQAANMYLVTMGGFGGSAPFLSHQGGHGATPTDPVVQALVLTAIVIGFATTALILVLAYRMYEEHGSIDLEKIANGKTKGEKE
jgi:multicomponent Na+:H+ antiporter subunit C